MYAITDLETFVAVAKRNSVSKAAGELGISIATASYRLSKLEQALNVLLFHRDNRNMTLTDEGLLFLERVEGILDDLYQAEIDIGGGDAPLQGHLRVTVSPWVLSRFIMPHLPKFQAMHPKLAIDFLTVDRLVSLVEEGQDCGIRIGALEDSALIAQKLADNERIICASPKLFDRFKVPTCLNDLEKLPWVYLPWQSSFDLQNADGRKCQIRVNSASSISVVGSDVLTEGALNGLGLAVKSRLAIQKELDCGDLIEVMPNSLIETKAPIWFLYPPNGRNGRKVKEFLKFIREVF
ncbi:LysR family transcriptional regulator [Terasakiella sp. A23]|uniref:LysR family transcriptional regulator n=1 Tax=Terasakiella sp. FCG-A23 TaxID=3080561 RepID=UPI00295336CD|nr:LysR family transcriptional regulator [Terasakiella sp. A23]MDV7338040.1 LysR family transcriptional regulator [Terasakiella sp. A23]